MATRITTLDGKPSISTPNSAVRDVQLAINNIRERLKAIEAAYNQLATVTINTDTTVDLSAILAAIAGLTFDLTQLEARVTALEGEVPTDVYVNGVFVGTRHVLNFIQGGGLRITGSDDTLLERVNILFEALVNLQLPIARGSLRLRGRAIGMLLGNSFGLLPGRLYVRGRPVTMSLSENLFLDIARATMHARGRSIDLDLSNNTVLAIQRGQLHIRGRTIDFSLSQDLFMAIERALLHARGRTITMSLTTTSSLDITRASRRIRGRQLAMQTQMHASRGSLHIRGRTLTMNLTTTTTFAITRGARKVRGRTIGLFPNTLQLQHADGTNGSTTFTDEIPGVTWTANGTGPAKKDTGTVKFGTASMKVVRSENDYIVSNGKAVYGSALAGDFTLECWFNLNNGTTNNQSIISVGSSDTNRCVIAVVSNLIVFFSQSSTRISASFTTTGSWVHVALCQSGTSLKLFVNGTQAGSTVTSCPMPSGTLTVALGSNSPHTAPPQSMDGFIDEFRYTRAALYTANFSVPTAAFQPPT